VLLAVMTVSSFGGPFLIAWVLGGGDQPDWPPDRLIEWVVFSAVVALVLTLVTFAVVLGWVHRHRLAAVRRAGSSHLGSRSKVP
jgi:hypothetical protein